MPWMQAGRLLATWPPAGPPGWVRALGAPQPPPLAAWRTPLGWPLVLALAGPLAWPLAALLPTWQGLVAGWGPAPPSASSAAPLWLVQLPAGQPLALCRPWLPAGPPPLARLGLARCSAQLARPQQGLGLGQRPSPPQPRPPSGPGCCQGRKVGICQASAWPACLMSQGPPRAQAPQNLLGHPPPLPLRVGRARLLLKPLPKLGAALRLGLCPPRSPRGHARQWASTFPSFRLLPHPKASAWSLVWPPPMCRRLRPPPRALAWLAPRLPASSHSARAIPRFAAR